MTVGGHIPNLSIAGVLLEAMEEGVMAADEGVLLEAMEEGVMAADVGVLLEAMEDG